MFELKLLKSSIFFLVKMFIYALFYLDLLTSQYIPLSVAMTLNLSQRRESLEQAGGPGGLTSVLAGN